ncbi:MAG: FHA domain-containing protein [Lachnospiraceae bacterium]|nr:FHA domain-containing protein [Lachnospiraceae bacterium]
MNIIQEMGRSYLIIEDRLAEGSEYMARMLTDNNIRGVLPCKRGLYQNKEVLKYDITNMKSLLNEYENRMMNFEDLADLLYEIASITAAGASYLLEESYYSYLPELIFIDMESDKPFMLFIPFEGEENRKEGRYRGLSEFFLEKIDHRDETAASIAYQFYRMSKESLFSLQGFCCLIEKERAGRQTIKHTGQIYEEKKDIRDSEIADKESSCHMIDEKQKREKTGDSRAIVVSAIITAILIICYIVIGKSSIYGVYMLLLTLIAIIVSFGLAVNHLIKAYRKKREDSLIVDMPANPVTVNEFWGGDEETVYFDEETQFFEAEQEDHAIEWMENGKERREILKKGTNYIGKKYEEVDVCIPDPTISRKHAKIIIRGDRVILQDLGSTNGTYFEGRRIDPEEEVRLLKNQDFILGKVAIRVV